jgi:hypothetical protein
MHVIDVKSKHSYAYRYSNYYCDDDSDLINNLHIFLNLYQKTYRIYLEDKYINNNILNLRHFGFNNKLGLITTITDKMDGTLYKI